MTVHHVPTCSCGHEIAWHPDKGACVYGKGTPTGGCTCEGFGRRKRPEARPAVEVARAVPVELLGAVEAAIAGLEQLRAALVGVGPAAAASPRAPARRASRLAGGPRSAATGPTPLRSGARRILEVVARHYPARLTRTQLATLAGFAPSGGTYQTYLSDLRRDGLIEEDAKLVGVTSAGIRASGLGAPSPMTRAEILERWRGALRAGARTMLDVVVQRGELTRTDLGGFAGLEPSAGTFGTYLSDLRRNGLVEVNGKMVRLGKALSEAR